MELKNNIKNVVLFHILSPGILFLAILIYLLSPRTLAIKYAIIVILLVDLLWNICTLFLTYNEIKLDTNSIIITRGIINKKTNRVPLKNVKGIETEGLRLVGFKSTNAIILLHGLFYNPGRDKIKVYQGYIDDLEFEKFKDELRKRIRK